MRITSALRQTIREEWVKALESGEYKQGQGALETIDDEGNHCYCCLGVACLIAQKHGIKVHFNEVDGRIGGGDFDIQPEVACALKLSPGKEGELISLNDTDDRSFVQIADYIRENWNFVFA